LDKINDSWAQSDSYDYFMGRWSKLMAPVFLDWVKAPESSKWLEIGCGTGALSEAIVHSANPNQLTSIDPSELFLEKAKERLQGKGEFIVGDASKLSFQENSFDIIVSGLALNFFPNIEKALSEMKRVIKPNGTIAAYVWDYSGRIDMIRYFWDAAFKMDPNSRDLDEGIRFPICTEKHLKKTVQKAGLSNVETTTLDIITHFKDFDDYWSPFLGGQGPAPGYLASLSNPLQEQLRNKVYSLLPFEKDGSIKILGRAIAVKANA